MLQCSSVVCACPRPAYFGSAFRYRAHFHATAVTGTVTFCCLLDVKKRFSNLAARSYDIRVSRRPRSCDQQQEGKACLQLLESTKDYQTMTIRSSFWFLFQSIAAVLLYAAACKAARVAPDAVAVAGVTGDPQPHWPMAFR